MPKPPRDFAALLDAATRVAAPPLCPEVRLHLSDDLESLWAHQESWLGRAGSPPYWGLAWPGGQALARHVLDNPALVGGRSVLDLGSGSGLVAIAAAMSGARTVDAADIDEFARATIQANARVNRVTIATPDVDPVGEPSRWEVVLAGDLWYELFTARRVTAWLRELASAGTLVLLGDNGRAFFPRQGAEEVRSYAVESPSPAKAPVAAAAVWRLRP